MPASIDVIFIVFSSLIILSILTIKLSNRFGIPSLVLFLAIGMLAGSDGLGGITFDNPSLVRSLGITALVLILFSGGLDTEWSAVRPIVWQGLSLSTIGVLITALLIGVFVAWVQGFHSWRASCSAPLCRPPMLRPSSWCYGREKPRSPRRLIQLLEFESGSNDPMAVVLTIALIRLLTEPSTSFGELVVFFVMQMAVGTVIGIAMGEIMRRSFNALDLELEGIYPVLSVALALLTYGLTDYLEGSGFLAVYLAGLVMQRKPFTHQQSVLRFHDGLAWLMQVTMFLTLGLTSISGKAPANRRGGHPDFPVPDLRRPPCERPRGAGFFADVVSRADAGSLGRAPRGRADHLGHISLSGRA